MRFDKVLDSCRGFLEEIGPERHPHNSTLIRFVGSVCEDDLQGIVSAFSLFCDSNLTVAVDGTGYSNFYRCAHYSRRRRDSKLVDASRTFTKLSIAVDVKTHLVLSGRACTTGKHDSCFIVEHVRDLTGLPIRYFLADKGYDSEQAHRFYGDPWVASV